MNEILVILYQSWIIFCKNLKLTFSSKGDVTIMIIFPLVAASFVLCAGSIFIFLTCGIK